MDRGVGDGAESEVGGDMKHPSEKSVDEMYYESMTRMKQKRRNRNRNKAARVSRQRNRREK